MSSANIDPKNGIRYSVVDFNSLNQDLLNETFYNLASDAYHEWLEKNWTEKDELFFSTATDEEKKERIRNTPHEDLEEEDLQYIEQVKEEYYENFDSSWLSGHQFTYEEDCEEYELIWSENVLFVVSSPYVIRARKCSPCVPNAINLEQPDRTGELGYALPKSFFREELQSDLAHHSYLMRHEGNSMRSFEVSLERPIEAINYKDAVSTFNETINSHKWMYLIDDQLVDSSKEENGDYEAKENKE